VELILPWYLFERSSGDPERAAGAGVQQDDSTHGGRIRCRACAAVITHEGQRTSIAGSHAHTCTNPGGYRHHFECYRHAPGCTVLGSATAEHSWFAGCRWQLAACSGCGAHLGWYFTGAACFFGLIDDRMYSEEG